MDIRLVLLLAVCGAEVLASQIPAGFVPLPPLPQGKPYTKKPIQPLKTKKPVRTNPTKKPQMTSAPGPASTPANCKYSITVPGSNCPTGGNSAVQQSLNTLQQQIGRTRAQQQAQATALQNMITNLQGQQSGYVTKIADLQNEVQNLVAAFNSLSSGGRVSTTPATAGGTAPGSISGTVLHAVQTVRHDLTQAVGDINDKFFNLSSQVIHNSMQETQLHQNIQGQITSQATEIGRVTQQVTDLNKQLQRLQLGGATTGATAADIAKLQADIQKVASDIRKYDSKQTSQFATLSGKTNSLGANIAQHTADLGNTMVAAQQSRTRLTAVETSVTNVHDEFAQFRQKYEPEILKVVQDLATQTNTTAQLNTGLRNIAGTVLSLSGQTATDRQNINGLAAQANQLNKDVRNLTRDLTSQNTEIVALRRGMRDLKTAIPTSSFSTMNTIISRVVNGGSATQQDFKDLQKALHDIQSNINAIKLTNPIG